jgi:hypothetical protein
VQSVSAGVGVCVSVYYIREGVRFVFVRVVLLCFTPSEQRRASDCFSLSLCAAGTLPGHARAAEIEFKLQQQQSKFCVSALYFGTQITETLKAQANK